MSEEQNEINNQYDDLKTVINDAARVKADINSTCKESLKNMKRDFSEFMYDNVAEEFKSTAERLGLFNGFADVEDKKKREKKIEGKERGGARGGRAWSLKVIDCKGIGGEKQ